MNADVGEGFGAYSIGDDEALMAVLTDVNIACGFHAGDPSIMRRSVELAVARGLGIGAHVGYADLRGFGRRDIDVSPADVYDDTVYQLGALQAVCTTLGGRVGYVKPHGALYHRAWVDAEVADAVVRAVRDVDSSLALVSPSGSAAEARAGELGIRAVAEGYIDRAYLPNGHLAPRSQPGALVSDPAVAVAQVMRMLTEQSVLSTSGDVVQLRAETLCVHSDSPGSARLAGAVRDQLLESGIDVQSFGHE